MRAVNLIPAEERRGAGGIAGRSGGVVYVLAGGLALLVAFGVVYALAVHTVANRKAELASVTQQVTAVNAESAALQPYVQIADISAEKVEQVVSLAEQRFDWPDAMAQLALAVPDDVTFTSLSASAPSSGSSAGATTTAPAASVGGSVPFSLIGCANSQGEIPAVLADLASVPGVTDVELQSSVEASAIKFHGLSTSPNHGFPSRSNEAVSGACPKITWTLSLTYNESYTVPKVKLPQGSSSGAQTVSSSSGAKTTIVQTASQRVTP